jgi:hypothetical protein
MFDVPSAASSFFQKKLFVENVTGRRAGGMNSKPLARRQRDSETSNERMLAICDKNAARFLRLSLWLTSAERGQGSACNKYVVVVTAAH